VPKATRAREMPRRPMYDRSGRPSDIPYEAVGSLRYYFDQCWARSSY
jgi:hypothetical protein